MHNITLINGDGIGPEICDAVVKIIDASGLKINWDLQTAGEDVIEKEGTPLPKRVLDSIRKNKIALKAPVTTPIGKGFRSVNVQLRKELGIRDMKSSVKIDRDTGFIFRRTFKDQIIPLLLTLFSTNLFALLSKWAAIAFVIFGIAWVGITEGIGKAMERRKSK